MREREREAEDNHQKTAYIHVYIYMYKNVCNQPEKCMCMYICTCICIHIRTCMCVLKTSVYVYIHVLIDTILSMLLSNYLPRYLDVCIFVELCVVDETLPCPMLGKERMIVWAGSPSPTQRLSALHSSDSSPPPQNTWTSALCHARVTDPCGRNPEYHVPLPVTLPNLG